MLPDDVSTITAYSTSHIQLRVIQYEFADDVSMITDAANVSGRTNAQMVECRRSRCREQEEDADVSDWGGVGGLGGFAVAQCL